MTREHRYQVGLEWSGAAQGPTSSYSGYSREFAIEIEGKPRLLGSADALFRGDRSRHNPEDLLVAALAGCHMLSYLAECARAGISVLAYTDLATGTMHFEGGGGRFVSVELHPRVVVESGTNLTLARELHEKAHASCFIARSVNFPVTNVPTILLPDPDEPPTAPEP
ncbi:OsmC family protein [Tundrisphaera lichenicola]|uniref:OsmC family protein n=1 Tax=Tundrisphaera lichenicola TaxID=2029860 RepID=UPI003EBF6FF4